MERGEALLEQGAEKRTILANSYMGIWGRIPGDAAERHGAVGASAH